MKLVSFSYRDGRKSYGTVDGDSILDAGGILGEKYPDLKAVLDRQAVPELRGIGSVVGLEEVALLPPIPEPDKILCIGLNYMAHIKESGRGKPEYPTIFTRCASSVVGHGTPLVRPKASEDFDYEGELAVIIGRRGRHISPADAWDYLAGYTCFNDGSVRDYQVHTSQFWPGKNFEASGSMGPWIVTPDEVGDITRQTLTTRIEGNVEQQAGIDDLAFGIPELISYASTVVTLLPGDVIATGTPGGVGRFRKPQLYLAPGMTAEIEVTGIGVLRNGIIDEA